MLNVVTLLVDSEPSQAALLDAVLASEFISGDDLRVPGVLASEEIELGRDLPAPERPPGQGQLG